MMSSVSAAMEACGAGSPEMILGWNMLNGFLGKSCLLFGKFFCVSKCVVQSTLYCSKDKSSVYLHV